MICPSCGKEIADGSNFCVECGANLNPGAQAYSQARYVDLKDHTAEFDAKDISENKVFAMLPYLMSVTGTIIAAIAANNSAYARFHVRESLKFTVCEVLLVICAVLFFWTLIIPVAAGICYLILFVCRIISFVRIGKGLAKEAPIVGGFGFLK